MGSMVGRQLNIRSDQAYQLATRIAGRRNGSITQAVVQALAELDARDSAAEEGTKEQTLARWMALLEEDWKHLDPSCDFKIEDLYDPVTGLPA